MYRANVRRLGKLIASHFLHVARCSGKHKWDCGLTCRSGDPVAFDITPETASPHYSLFTKRDYIILLRKIVCCAVSHVSQYYTKSTPIGRFPLRSRVAVSEFVISGPISCVWCDVWQTYSLPLQLADPELWAISITPAENIQCNSQAFCRNELKTWLSYGYSSIRSFYQVYSKRRFAINLI